MRPRTCKANLRCSQLPPTQHNTATNTNGSATSSPPSLPRQKPRQRTQDITQSFRTIFERFNLPFAPPIRFAPPNTMPVSAKRGHRGRRDVRKDEAASALADLGDSSPTRPAKRRKQIRSPSQSIAAARPGSRGRGVRDANTTDDLEVETADANEDEIDNEDHTSPNTAEDDDHIISQVTQNLKAQPVQASKDYANSIHEANGDAVKAYAKVAAQDWTFYITKLAVNIGRAPETAQVDAKDEDTVHIDLGPSKMVSREHAAICFDSKDGRWFLQVKGRNGAKVDGQPVKSGSSHPLTSGEVIEIANVEMMFVLPSETSPLHVHSTFLERSGLSVTETSKSRPARRQPLIAPAPPDYRRPGTPPMSSQVRNPASSMKSPAVVIGANSGVDLSQDENQHIKPQYSYAQMITQAIINAPDGKLNLNGIYTFIMNNYSYYRHQQASGWQNSIRHNLSLNKAFDKVARSTDEPGKGMKWQIVPEAKEEMIRIAYRIGRGGHRGSSAPSSPNQLNYITHGPKDMASRDPTSARKRRGSPLASPTPRPSHRIIQSTPERGRLSDRLVGRNIATPIADGSPLPRPRRSNEPDSSFSSFAPQSPSLTSSYLQDEGTSFVTPAPPKIIPRLAPPSTAQRPSQHMPTSSPAPFWKFVDIGSTPLKPSMHYSYEASPSKRSRVPLPQSSSPPRANEKSPPSSPSRPHKPSPTKEPDSEPADAEEDEGFDLTKGFQSIGAYHAPVSRGLSIPSALE
ncbi:fork head domain-containing protein [Stachybotrys elegans]|uniref:Fork head domain-containing protein n=1 Tax=Stachybotrys elegans TaxID=80388 RepID=A0A8K0WQ20_9HYPO|nr:fork head domain-containing protein [Stachybotrys elegans]